MMTAAFLAFGTFWMAQLMESDTGLSTDALKNEPDYIVEHFSVVRMSPAGQPRYIVSGDKLTHRPVDDTAEIEKPLVQSIGEGVAPTTISAKRARVDHGNTQVHLMGDVNVDRKATATTRPMIMRTQALTVYPEDDQMKTDQPFEIVSDGATMNGTGLFVDNTTRKVNVNTRVRVVYPPRPQTK